VRNKINKQIKLFVNTQQFYYVKWLHVSAALCGNHQAKLENGKKEDT
jgi:hypothetical protein